MMICDSVTINGPGAAILAIRSNGFAKVGVFRNGAWYLDYNNNDGAWNGCGINRCYSGSFSRRGD